MIRRREEVLTEHEGRVERRDVHVEDIARNALVEHGRVTARHATTRLRGWHGPTVVEVLPQQECVDLGGVAAQGGHLVVEGQGLGLDEVRRRQDGRQREGLSDVVPLAGAQEELVDGVVPEPIGRVRGARPRPDVCWQ